MPRRGPITGNDLEDLRKILGLSVTDLTFLFGFSMPHWGKIKKAADNPVRDPAVALLARWWLAHPETCPIHQSPTPAFVRDSINEILATDPLGEDAPLNGPVSKKDFGLSFGREMSAGYRWTRDNGKVPPVLNRLLTIAQEQINRNPETFWKEWIGLVEEEAKARGIDDLWAEGNWHKDLVAPRHPAQESANADDGDDGSD
ncbi:hypothetical protein [Telmatospirillum siberiense]|uniref:Uncharacterized protein n=1 Tax=Telmatospirillum siberiense TaxID=382514 RepID=A0A2N3PNI4_9PROT|nr:hypothetical protein [Telmatospirillum siberiense]PKU21957.1 hypothetical protein CWS72_23935 [Telmatospirillum siberiense]